MMKLVLLLQQKTSLNKKFMTIIMQNTLCHSPIPSSRADLRLVTYSEDKESTNPWKKKIATARYQISITSEYCDVLVTVTAEKLPTN